MRTFQDITSKIARLVDPNPSVEVMRMIEDLVLNYRALLIKRDLDKGRSLTDRLVQTIVNVPLEVTSYNPGTVNLFALKTKERIPSIVRLAKGYAIRFAGTNTRNVDYTYVDINSLRLLYHSRYTYKDNIFTFLDNYIYVFKERVHIDRNDYDVNFYPQSVRIEAVFENPLELFDFYGTDGKAAYDLDYEFPLTEDLEQQITQSIISQELQLLNPLRTTEINSDGQ